MYSTAGHKQKRRTKHNPQQAAQQSTNRSTKKTPTLKLPKLEMQSLKK